MVERGDPLRGPEADERLALRRGRDGAVMGKGKIC